MTVLADYEWRLSQTPPPGTPAPSGPPSGPSHPTPTRPGEPAPPKNSLSRGELCRRPAGTSTPSTSGSAGTFSQVPRQAPAPGVDVTDRPCPRAAGLAPARVLGMTSRAGATHRDVWVLRLVSLALGLLLPPGAAVLVWGTASHAAALTALAGLFLWQWVAATPRVLWPRGDAR